MTDTLWLLVGRGGSKGVPGKNMRRIGGLSLIEWKARAARAADPKAYIVCSSDSHEILEEAQNCGASWLVPRPEYLATDTASTADVVKHALEALAAGPGMAYDRVVLLEPSAPFTKGETYRHALTMMNFYDADLVVGMKTVEPHQSFVGDIRDDGSVTPIIIGFQRHARRRQDYPKQWTMAGNLYVFKTEMFLRTGDIYGGAVNLGLLTDRWHGTEIDTPEDLELAEYAFAKGHVACV